MASRKDQKEQARQRRLAEEQMRAERARRQRRLRMLGGVILAAIIVVGIAVAVSTSGGKNKNSGLQTGTKASQTVSQVSALLSGIPQSGAVLGNPSAPVTMTYYGDLQCPVCADFTLGKNGAGWPQLVANEVRSGKVKVVYKAFQTATRDPSTFKTQQVAALAAGRQNHFWDFAELFYHYQGTEGTGYVTENFLDTIAHQISGLTFAKWQTDRSDAALAAQVASDESTGSAAGVNATPTLVFVGPKGKPVALPEAAPYSDLQKAISQVS